MDTFSVKHNYETEINNIWKDKKFNDIEIISRGFGIQDLILRNSIMFIGINPSYDEKSFKKHEKFYNVEQDGKSHSYFNKFKEISKKLNHHWTYFDLLYFRETNQKYINKLLNKPNGVDFVFKQLEISKKVIYDANPKILIISNTMARHFMGFEKNQENTLGVWMGFDFEFDQKLGTYRIVNDLKLNNTPVFFTSMLSGQRALDNGSFERLIWHLNFVLNLLN